MFCEICHEQEATIHTTHIVDDVTKHRNLCERCFEASKPAEARDLAKALDDGCRYCGGEPYIGGGTPIDRLRGVLTISFMCKPCKDEYYSFLRQKCPNIGKVLTAEEVAKIPAIIVEADEHMKKWVAKNNKDIHGL